MLTPQEEEEIRKGLTDEGRMRRTAENKLFNKLKIEFIRKGVHKYHLSKQDATDAYVETIRSVILNIDNGAYQLHPGKSLTGYAVSIFQNKCIDIKRRTTKATDPIDESLIHQLPDEVTDIINAIIDAKGLRLKIHQCYEKTGELCRAVLELSTDGFTDKEIAERLSFTTKDAAKQKRYTCLRKLADCLNLPKDE